VWHTPLLFIVYSSAKWPTNIIHAQGCYYCKQYKSFFLFPPLIICPCDGAHYKPRMCITKTQSVFVQHQDVSGHHQDTSWSDKRAVKRAVKRVVQKRCRQKFLYCLQIRTTYLMCTNCTYHSCSTNLVKIIIIFKKKNKSLAAPIWIFQNFDNN
jgi:hypothetical protein